MRIAIDHRTRYRFSEPQARVVQLLRMTPQDSAHQTVVHWHIGVDCDARLRDTRDGFGNRVTMLYASGPLEGIEITVTGEVLTAEAHGMVDGAGEPLPPLLFLRATDRTRADEGLAAFAHQRATGSAIERLHRFNTALSARFEIVVERHDAGRTAREAFGDATASSRDLAHLFIAGVRSLGVPARYVTGYRPVEHGHAPTPHAWAEAYVEALGWVAFDPSRGCSADETYVRVAIGPDAATCAPVAGSRLGPGNEALDVDLQVAAVRDGA